MKNLYISEISQIVSKIEIDKINMSKDFNNALLEASLTSFTTQILEIQIAVSKMEMDMIRKCEGKSRKVQNHTEMIKICRKGIEKCDEILKDVRSYFIDVKIYPAYQMFQSIFRLITYFTKIVSEAYLYRYKAEKTGAHEKVIEMKPQECACMCVRRNNEKKIQKIDYELTIMERQQLLILSQMQKLSKNLCSDRDKIEKISSDKKNLAFGELENTFNEISMKTENILNAFFKNNELQSKFYATLYNGTDLLLQIQQEMKKQIIKLFPTCLKKIIYLMISHLKEKQIFRNKRYMSTNYQLISSKNQNKEELKESMKIRRSLVQNDIQMQQEGINSDLLMQIKRLKKQIQNKEKDNEKLKETIKQFERQIFIIQNQYKNLQKIFKTRTLQLEQCKTQLSWSNRLNFFIKEKNAKEIDTLSKSKRRRPDEKIETFDKWTQTVEEDFISDTQELESLVEKSKILKWSQKKNHKRYKYDPRNKEKEPNIKVTMEALVQKMNEVLKLNNQDFFKKSLETENIDQIIIKWKEGIDSRAGELNKSPNSKTRNSSKVEAKSKSKNNKKGTHKRMSFVNKKDEKRKALNLKNQKQNNKSVATQTLEAPNKTKQNEEGCTTSRAHTFRSKKHEKTLSHKNLNCSSQGISRKDNFDLRNSMNFALKSKQNRQKTLEDSDKKNHQFLRFSSNLESIQEKPSKPLQKEKICFEEFDFGAFPESNKPSKSIEYEGYLKEKTKREETQKEASKQRWRDIFEKKKKSEAEKQKDSILVKLENLDFAIWSAKMEEFIKGTKESDPKKYEKFTMDMLSFLRNKIGYQAIQKAYERYAACYFENDTQKMSQIMIGDVSFKKI